MQKTSSPFGFLQRYWVILPVLFALVLWITRWFWPAALGTVTILIVLLSLTVAISRIIAYQVQSQREGRLDRAGMFRNIALELIGMLLAVTLAVLLGRTLIGLATRSIEDDLTRLILALVVGLLVGLGVGILVSRTWGRFVKNSAES